MSGLPLKLISSMAAREVLAELAVAFGRDFSLSLTTESAGAVQVRNRVMAGEVMDIVVLSSAVVDELIAAGRLRVGSRVDLMRSGIAVAVRQGAERPDISDEVALKRAILGTRSLGYSTGASGVYLKRLFERWGILPQIRARIVVPAPGTPVGALVADGTCELGFQQMSELMNLQGVQVLGLLPPKIQAITIFSGGITASCVDPVAAQCALEYMAGPATAQIKRRYGMEPA